MPALVTIDLKQAPRVISDSVRCVLKVHGIELPEDVLIELGNNAAQALFVLDESETYAPSSKTVDEVFAATREAVGL